MPVSRVVDERVLTPISEQKPAGDDLRALRDWVDIRKARPNQNDLGDKKEWEPANPTKADWPTYKDVVEKALCAKSKDLELGVFLTEACGRIYGFAGIRDGIWTLKGLLNDFSNRGLYPLPDEDGSLESRYGKLDWMNEKLAELVRDIPITMRPEPGENYSMNFRNEALRPNGMITAAEFETAVAVGTKEQYETLSKEIAGVQAELSEFEETVVGQFGPNALSFADSKHALEECQLAIASILRKKQPTVSKTPASAVTIPSLGSGSGGGLAEGMVSGAWAEAERMARSGEIDAALSTMTALASAEANGRIRFQRKLLLADICLQTNRVKLARSILEELNELIDKHNLTSWETSDLVGAVWGRLVRCYRDKNGGTANSDKAAEVFLKLSRLDPWQALSLGEPKESQ
jgi:type VI secretion system ImpA family protein